MPTGCSGRKHKKTARPEEGCLPPCHPLHGGGLGAGQDEPLSEFPRALSRTLLEVGIEKSMAKQLIDTGEGEGQMGKGKGNKGNGKGHKGKGKG